MYQLCRLCQATRKSGPTAAAETDEISGSPLGTTIGIATGRGKLTFPQLVDRVAVPEQFPPVHPIPRPLGCTAKETGPVAGRTG
jgi:hypothetical protein